MGIVVVIIFGLILAAAAGFTLFLLAGPFLAGRYASPPERRIDRRHRIPPERREMPTKP